MEGPDRLRVSWSLPPVPGPLVGDGFLLRLWDGARGQERRENVSSPQARTALLTGLTPGTHYQLDVRLYHCTLLGPASPAARVLLPPSGTLGRGWPAPNEGGPGVPGTHRAREDVEATGAWMDRQRPQDVETGAQGGSGCQADREDRTGEDPGCREDVGLQE